MWHKGPIFAPTTSETPEPREMGLIKSWELDDGKMTLSFRQEAYKGGGCVGQIKGECQHPCDKKDCNENVGTLRLCFSSVTLNQQQGTPWETDKLILRPNPTYLLRLQMWVKWFTWEQDSIGKSDTCCWSHNQNTTHYRNVIMKSKKCSYSLHFPAHYSSLSHPPHASTHLLIAKRTSTSYKRGTNLRPETQGQI